MAKIQALVSTFFLSGACPGGLTLHDHWLPGFHRCPPGKLPNGCPDGFPHLGFPHPLTKSHICHLGVIFFLCGPNEKTKIVSKALIDCATQQRVSKFENFSIFFFKNKNIFLPLIITFFSSKFLILGKKTSFVCF